MEIAKGWKDYQILGMSDGYKLEKWGKYNLFRPDPSVIWMDNIDKSKIDATYIRSNKGGGHWEMHNSIKDSWHIRYKDLVFNLKLMGFKHTGLFPEQAVNWDFMRELIRESNRDIKVLNLFAYTGAASVACLKEGAGVVHVDSSRGMVDWAKENVASNHLENRPIRYIVDDVVKFVKREIRRGNKYDAIIMDPPSYGRGSNKEVWQLEKDLFNLVELCCQLLSDNPLFFIINSYTAGLSPVVLDNIFALTVCKGRKAEVTSCEIGLESIDGMILPCGVCGRVKF